MDGEERKEMEDLEYARPFDPNSRADWFRTDLRGVFDTGVIVTCSLFIFGAIASFVTWSNVFKILLDPVIQMIIVRVGMNAVVPVLLLGLVVIPSFMIVFVLRLNFTVDEERRFRYLFRWL